MKIPTVLGLSLLITAISLGILIYYFDKKTETEERITYLPRDIQVLNIFDDQATVTWETENPAIGTVSYSDSGSMNQSQTDNRDHTGNQKERTVHFVTLRNLHPDTDYNFKVKSHNHAFPDKPMSFKTAKTLPTETSGENDEVPSAPENKPLRGSVLNTNLNPIDEALVFLQITGAQPMVTFTSTSGNFLIPLSRLRDQNGTNVFTITENTPAKLIIKKGELVSEIEVNLPIPNNQLLPPLTIGQSISYQDLIAQSQITPRELPSTLESRSRYDLNGDGTINTLDLATVLQYFGRPIDENSENDIKRTDFNTDGTIDQKDIDLLTLNL